MTSVFRRAGWVPAALLPVLVVFAVCSVNALAWVGRPFSGFLFLESGVIVSIGRSDWIPPRRRSAQWTRVLAMDGRPVARGHEIHDYVKAVGVGKPITYTFRGGAEIFRLALSVRPFVARDFIELFAPLLAVGLLIALVGAFVTVYRPEAPEVRGLFVVCLGVGLNLITAPDEYFPYWFTPVYFLSLCSIPPSIIYVALHYPRRRELLRRGAVVQAALYLPFLGLGLALLALRSEPALFLPLLYAVYFLMANALVLYVGGVVLAVIEGVRPLQPLVLALAAVFGTGALVMTTLVTYPLLQQPLSPAWLVVPLLLIPVLTGIAFVRFPNLGPPGGEDGPDPAASVSPPGVGAAGPPSPPSAPRSPERW